MQALATALLYFGTFLVIGWVARCALDGWMRRSGADLDDVQRQSGAHRGRRRLFLLGAWRSED